MEPAERQGQALCKACGAVEGKHPWGPSLCSPVKPYDSSWFIAMKHKEFNTGCSWWFIIKLQVIIIIPWCLIYWFVIINDDVPHERKIKKDHVRYAHVTKPCSRPQNISVKSFTSWSFSRQPRIIQNPIWTCRASVFCLFDGYFKQRSWIDPPISCVHLKSFSPGIGATLWERSTEVHVSDDKSSFLSCRLKDGDKRCSSYPWRIHGAAMIPFIYPLYVSTMDPMGYCSSMLKVTLFFLVFWATFFIENLWSNGSNGSARYHRPRFGNSCRKCHSCELWKSCVRPGGLMGII